MSLPKIDSMHSFPRTPHTYNFYYGVFRLTVQWIVKVS